MIDRNYIIPPLYKKMNEKGFTNPNNEAYLWLNEMEWMPIDKIREYEYDNGESKLIIPFAITGGGDKWVWIANGDDKEYCVGLCENAEVNGTYYAKNTEDAIFRQIIEYVSDSNFYLIKEEAESYQVSEEELKIQLEGWRNNFEGILNDEYINIIAELRKLSLKHIKCQYGEWYALLTLEEQDELIDKYIKFDLIDNGFEWYLE